MILYCLLFCCFVFATKYKYDELAFFAALNSTGFFGLASHCLVCSLRVLYGTAINEITVSIDVKNSSCLLELGFY